MTSAVKALLFVLFLVLIPTVPITIAVSRAMRSRRMPAERELTAGRASSTPFRMISVVGMAITAGVFAALLIVLAAQSFADSDDGESVPGWPTTWVRTCAARFEREHRLYAEGDLSALEAR